MAAAVAEVNGQDQAGYHAFIADHFEGSRLVMEAAARSAPFQASLVQVSALMIETLRAGGKLMFAGNGGSASDAQHIACEFVARLNFDRAPLAGLALTTDSSTLTSVGNDYGFDHVFERQVRALGRAGDVFVGISTSGRSRNVLLALEAARQAGIHTVGFGGEGETAMSAVCDLMVAAPSTATPMIQQVHITAAHAICGLVELAMFPRHG